MSIERFDGSREPEEEADFAARAERLSPAQSALLERLRGGRAQSPAAPSSQEADPRPHAPFPLTDLQQAYWIGRDPALPLGGVAAFGYAEFDVDNLDLTRLETAWNHLIRRHPALRTVISPAGEQRILPVVPPYRLRVDDLRALSAAERTDRLARVRAELSHQVLRTDEWPLFDVRATRVEGALVRVHVGFDTLIVDARSFDILAYELDALLVDPDARLKPLGFTFKDYVERTTGEAAAEPRERARAYWFDRLDALPPGPELPLATAATVSTARFVRYQTPLDAGVWRSLSTRARDRRLTPSSLLLSAYVETLASWSSAPAFTLNVTLFNRRPVHDDIDDVVGCFTELSLLEVDTTRPETFENRAQRIQAQLWSDLDHREVGAMEVLREIARRSGVQPIMPVVFTSALGTGGGGRSQLGRPVYAISQTPQVSIDFQVVESGDGVDLWWDVAEEVFPPGMVRDLFDAYVDLVRRLAEGEEAWESWHPVGLPGRMGAARQARERVAVRGERRLLHEIIDLGDKDRCAVASPGGSTTRGELDALADRAAAALQKAGVAPNDLVGVVTGRGASQVAAVLGVLRAGGAYVPLSPDLPAARLQELIERARLKLLVTDAATAATELPFGLGRIRMDRDLPDAAPRPAGSRPGDLAYVIFTSGTSGTPKGVMISHEAAVNTVLDVRDRLALAADDAVIALSELSFDLSVFDIFGTLSAGATLVTLADGVAAKDPAHWAERVDRHRVTVWNSVPALMGMFVDHLTSVPGPAPRLRVALLSGDWIPLDLPARIRRVAPQASVISGGGATEASIWSVLYPIDHVDASWKSIPYGAPLTNQTARVNDRLGEEVPDWVTGELYIGGDGVAVGYWDDPARTAERFVPDPARLGGRRYRTGDNARHVAGGLLEFLGRTDSQVKVNGYRIDLSEIERELATHPAVVRACVLASGPRDGARKLRAFVVTTDDSAVAEIRRRAAMRLPDYMVPAAVEAIDELPLTRNGKVDRARLADLPWPQPEKAPSPAAPSRARSRPIEALVTELVAAVLELRPAPGPEDDLLQLGADSLTIVRIGRGLQERLGFAPSLSQVFADPTVGGIAAALEAHLVESFRPDRAGETAALAAAKPGVPASLRGDDQGWLPLARAQERVYVLERLAPGESGLYVPAVVRLRGEIDETALRRALDGLVARHDALRTVFDVQGTTVVQRALPASGVPLEIRRVAGEDEALRRVGEEARRPFDLAAGPTVRALAIGYAPSEWLIQLTFHHLTCDEHSLRLALGEVLALYAAHTLGQPAELAESPRPYRSYVTRELAEAGDLAAGLRYWRQQLAGLPAPPPIAQGPPYRAAIDVRPEAVAALQALARAERSTLTCAVLAAFVLALRGPLDRDDVVIGIPFNSRGAEYEATVGMFVNTLAIRSRAPGAATFRELLCAVRRDLTGALDHADVPYNHVVSAVRPGGGLTELFDAWLVIRETHPVMSTAGLSLTPVDVTAIVAKHSLKLDLDVDSEGLRGMLLGRPPLWQPATVDRLAAEVSTALTRVAEFPDEPLTDALAAIRREADQLLSRRRDDAARSARDRLRATTRSRS
jgi:amino acid adenylation domain-containing protein